MTVKRARGKRAEREQGGGMMTIPRFIAICFRLLYNINASRPNLHSVFVMSLPAVISGEFLMV